MAANAEKHPLRPPCNCNLKCEEALSEKRRREIHDEFWGLPRKSQKAWIIATVTSQKPERPRKDTQAQRERNSARKYYLKDDKYERRQVCALMYRRTLGYEYDTFLRYVFTSMSKSGDGNILPPPDKRGRHEPSNKIPEENIDVIRKHILSYNPALPHYRRKHAPNRRYLTSELSIATMHGDYSEIEDVRKVGYWVYERELNKLNVSFAKLGCEDCEHCDIQKEHMKVHQSSENELEPDGVCIYPQICDTCMEFKKHDAAVDGVRAEYQKDVANVANVENVDSAYYSCDMQKVVMLPRMPGYKVAIFTKRMVAFHETFAPIGEFVQEKPTGVIWNESITGRNADDLASCYVNFIRKVRSERNVKKFFIWADNCSGQNKNWTLFTALVAEVNKKDGPSVISVKFFEPGHTFMSADSFHHTVEQRMRKVKNVFDFDSFADVINYKGVALELQAFDFIAYPKGVSSGKFAADKPKLENVREVQFRKGYQEMFWKESFKEESFKSAVFLVKKISREVLKGNMNYYKRKTVERGILASKKADIVVKLCPLMTNSKSKAYWMSLPDSDDVVDLADKREDGEYVYKD